VVLSLLEEMAAETAPPPEAPPGPCAALRKVEVVATPRGEVEVCVCEPRSAACAVAIFIHGKSPRVIWEWQDLAPKVRDRGVAVIYPNFHSCPATTPGSGSDEAVLGALQTILRWVRERHSDLPVILYGKSWGGAQALSLAVADEVQGLVLACPSPKVPFDLAGALGALATPVLLLWARDDDTIPFEHHELFLGPLRARPAGEKRTIFEALHAGGHRIEPMLELERTREKLLTWPDLVPLLGRIS